MNTFEFKAIGTAWKITIDGESIGEGGRARILRDIEDFEARFSRFRPGSEVNRFRASEAGQYPISSEFSILLSRAARLRVLTDGAYDPAAGKLLEQAGYDASYSLTPSPDTDSFLLPSWELREDMLAIDGPTAFDLGGIGKGYCIDKVVLLMRELGFEHFMVDAGGDMYGTSKKDGAPWRVAIQYPGKPDIAAGMAFLKESAVAVSDSYRRRWGKWHHIVDPRTRSAVESVVGAAAVAESAWDADCMTSALFLGAPEAYKEAAELFNAEYLVFREDGSCLKSNNWQGEVY